jgi:hypothetical protein
MDNNQLPQMPPMQTAPEVQEAAPVQSLPQAPVVAPEAAPVIPRAPIVPQAPPAPAAPQVDLVKQVELEKQKEAELKLQRRVEAALARGVSEEVVEAFLKAKGGVKVRATTKGIYPNCIRRKRGDEFKVAQLEDFSTTWHELVK